MEFWRCPDCRRIIIGSFRVVLALAGAHRCPDARLVAHPTVCLACAADPTGFCAVHRRAFMADLVQMGLE